MNKVRKMIAWASGLIEFIGDEDEPDGAIHVCTTYHPHALEELLTHVQEQSVLYDFGDVVGLRIPEIDPKRQQDGVGVDDAVNHLIFWEDYLRGRVGDHCGIVWMRA